MVITIITKLFYAYYKHGYYNFNDLFFYFLPIFHNGSSVDAVHHRQPRWNRGVATTLPEPLAVPGCPRFASLPVFAVPELCRMITTKDGGGEPQRLMSRSRGFQQIG